MGKFGSFSKLIILLFLLIIFQVLIFAQETGGREGIFISPFAEFVYYGIETPAWSAGLAASHGDRAAVGLRVMYAQAFDKKLTSLEITPFFRFAILNWDAGEGPFVQLTAGFVIFSATGGLSIPAAGGSVSAGLITGWRFLLGKFIYIEPYVRAGFPYYWGTGVCAGVRL